METERIREISVEGCARLAAGCTGECYRADDETVIKLYFEKMDPALAEREKRYARAAFVAGVPTAISFDLVRAGNRLGVVYEALNRGSLSDAIRREPDRAAEYALLFARTARSVHASRGDASIFPDAREKYAAAVSRAPYLKAREREALNRRIVSLPAADTLVHGDLHTSNIMLGGDGSPILIDMGDMARGNIWFDIGHVYNIYAAGALDGACELVTGIPGEIGARIWRSFVNAYFGAPDEKETARIEKTAGLYRYLRLIEVVNLLPERENLKREILEDFLPRLDDWDWINYAH